MNIFSKEHIANSYDGYYNTEFGKKVDEIEKGIISDLLSDIPTSQMLDIGCGTGHWSEFFIKKGFKVKGIDVSEAMLKVAQKKNMNAEFFLANSEQLPFENESYNFISSITMLEFVENQTKAIEELHRVLAKNGNLIIGALNKNSVIAKISKSDEVFKSAVFFDLEDLKNKFNKFEITKVKTGLYIDDNLNIFESSQNIEPAFMAILLRKN